MFSTQPRPDKKFVGRGLQPETDKFFVGPWRGQTTYRSGIKSSEITQNDHTFTFESRLFHFYDFETNLKISRLISGNHRLINNLSYLQIELTER